MGLLLVAVSVLLGAKLLGEADDTVRVWATTRDLAAGSPLSAGDLAPREIRFGKADAAARYLSAASPVPADATLDRAVGAGELLPAAALGGSEQDLTQVPLAIPPAGVPAAVRPGSRVDVWVTPEQTSGEPADRSIKVFDDVTVVAAPRSGSALAPAPTSQLVIGVPASNEIDLGQRIAQLRSGALLVTRQG